MPTDSTTHVGSMPRGPRFFGVVGPCEMKNPVSQIVDMMIIQPKNETARTR